MIESKISLKNNKVSKDKKIKVRETKIYNINLNVTEIDKNTNKIFFFDQDLSEPSYFENIKFDYMSKNFGKFKEYLEKPEKIIKPKQIKSNSSSPNGFINFHQNWNLLKSVKNSKNSVKKLENLNSIDIMRILKNGNQSKGKK